VQINAGTPIKLVEWISESTTEDKMNYYTIFCLTYRYFMEAGLLLEELMRLYKSYGNDESSKPKRMNVVNFLHHWIRRHYKTDFEPKPELCEQVKLFIKLIEDTDGQTVSKTILKGLDKTILDITKSINKRHSRKARLILGQSHNESDNVVFSEPPPEPIFPNNPIRNFLDISPIEIARQITLKDHELFAAIEASECLQCAWSGKRQKELAPNILRMIDTFNKNSSTVVTSIVKEESLKQRSNMLFHWITVVEELKNLNNFNGMITVIASLSTSPIFRLKKSWQKIPRAKLETYQTSCAIISTDSASSRYRKHVAKCNPPIVPHLGLYLQDLTFIEDGNPIRLDNGLINFQKCRMIGAQILGMQKYQQERYNLTLIPEIQSYIQKFPFMTEDEQFDLSLEREPRITKKPS